MALLFLASFGPFTFAQNAAAAAPADAAQKPKFEWNTETMTSASIANDVQSKILVLTKMADEDVKKIRKEKAGTEEEHKAMIKAVRDKCEKDIQALLTPEQKKKVNAIRKELRGKG